MHEAIPSPVRIIQIDYWTMLSLLFPGVFWLIYLGAAMFGFFSDVRGYDPLLGAQGIPFLFWLGIAGLVVGLPTASYRIRMIRSVFASGVEAPGVLTSLSFYRDRGRAEYTFQMGEQRLQSGNALHKTERTRALQVGQAVTLAVDPANPKRAFIRSLYLDD